MEGERILWNLSLYLAMINGDAEQDKFEQLYWQYRDLMFYRARQFLDEYLAEDAVSTAFLHIAQNINKVEEAVSPRTKALVMRIVENAAIDIYRKRRREQGYETEMTQLENCSVEQDDWANSSLAEAILLLPLPYKQVILLRYKHGYSTREIAELLHYTVAKVEKLISRGKKQLEQLLKEVYRK